MAKRNGRRTKVPGITALGSGRYRVRVRVTDPKTGRVVERERLVDGTTLKQALVIKEELARAVRASEARKEEHTTVGDFARTWLRGAWTSLAPSTRERYVAALDDHILPALGEMAMADVTFADIETWRDRLRSSGYAASTVNSHLSILRTLFGKAVAVGAADRNPAAAVRLLSLEDARTSDDEPNALTASELARFLTVARQRHARHFPMILTLATTGMRLSAARALRWEDVDEPRGVIVVRRRVSGSNDEVLAGVKRSRTGRDIVPLLPELAQVLTEHREAMSERERGSGWVFPTRLGAPRTRTVLRKPFADILVHAGITKRFTPHGLRRTANDLYRQVASPVVTMAITGHRTDAMFEHYSTVSDAEKQAAAARAFGEVVSPAKVGDRMGDSEPKTTKAG